MRHSARARRILLLIVLALALGSGASQLGGSEAGVADDPGGIIDGR